VERRAGTHFLDTGAHFYDVYETSDGGHVAVGPIEPQFYAELLRQLELDPVITAQWDEDRWPELRDRFAAVFRRRTRDQWGVILEPAEVCATAINGLTEAITHPHMAARGTFVDVGGLRQRGPAARFSRTPDPPGRGRSRYRHGPGRVGCAGDRATDAAGRARHRVTHAGSCWPRRRWRLLWKQPTRTLTRRAADRTPA
jgi:crotonobetainyl-CoA:carnitine CoA-transferase CaiB-like acyl-CoA transferase